MKRRNGFSLIELIIVIAIIAVISTIAAFSWNRYVANANLRTASRELEADIFLIKERAVSERIHYRISLEGAHSYTIDQGGMASGDAYTVLQTKNPATFGSGISLLDTNFANARIIFQPRGTLGSGTGRVRLKNNRNSISTITVNLSGRTYVQFAMQ